MCRRAHTYTLALARAHTYTLALARAHTYTVALARTLTLYLLAHMLLNSHESDVPGRFRPSHAHLS